MGVNEENLQVVVSLSSSHILRKTKLFHRKVGIKPLSTPFLGFQGSRESTKIKK